MTVFIPRTPRKRCTGPCGADKSLGAFHRDANRPDGHRSRCKVCATQRRYYEEHREEVQRYQDEYHTGLRKQVLDHYGWECACCRRTDKLCIDHVNGNGAEHRQELFGKSRSVGSHAVHRWLIANGFPEGYQTLCGPCNTSKGTGTACRMHNP